MSGPDAKLRLSIVVPCFNEHGNLRRLAAELEASLKPWSGDYEVLFIDDASSDGTPLVLAELAARDPRVRVLTHAINCGQSAGHASGFSAARGEILVTLDGDGQNDPADIPLLLQELEGADAVCGVRMVRDDGWIRRLSSRIANRVRSAVTGDPFRDTGCALRAFRAEVLHEIPVFNGMHRFLPTLLWLQGYRVREVETNHRPRTWGDSKYGVSNRLFRGIVDLLAISWYARRRVPARRLVDAGGRAPRRPE